MGISVRTAPVQRGHAGPGGASTFWKRKKFMIAAGVVVLAMAYLVTVGIQNAAMYYLTVDELLARSETSIGERVRLGGTAAQDSVHTVSGGTTLHFDVTDGQRSIAVTYVGIVPDAFKPGGEVVLEGVLTSEGTFNADTLLAKCPSKYVPSL